MNDFSWLEPLLLSIKKIFAAGWQQAKKWPVAIPLAIAIIALSLDLVKMLHSNYVALNEKHFTVYVGPPGSSSSYTGDKIRSAVNDVSSAPGTHFRASVASLASTTDVDDKIAADSEGRSIGVSVDKSDATDGVKMLLPLDWEYLHVLANVNFLARVRQAGKPAGSAGESVKKWPSQFSEVADQLKYGRVYADGGSRKLATSLIERHWNHEGKSLADFQAPGISNWEMAIAALNADQLDLVFFSGRLGATTVNSIAKAQSAILLGLDDVAKALKDDVEPTLFVTNFPENSYGETPFQVPGLPAIDFHFCGENLTTVATRRLVIASSHLSDSDAYLICDTLAAELSQSDGQPDNTWKRISPDDPQAFAAADGYAPFGIAPHAGAKMAREGAVLPSLWHPTTWNTWAQALGIAFLSLVATSLLNSFNKTKTPKPAEAKHLPSAPAPAAAEREAARALEAETVKLLHELDLTKGPISAQAYQAYEERVDQLAKNIRAQRAARQISRDEAKILSAGSRELYAELEILNPTEPAPIATT